jgi:UDP-N-acetylglucosamine 1-carboxyvinyltransferase
VAEHTEAVERLLIRPSGPLQGRVRVGGAKNSALKLMAATVLAEGTHRIRNVPRISDVEWMADLLGSMGLAVSWTGAHDLEIVRPASIVAEAPYDLVEKMRASIVVLGPLLAREGRARVALPGGDDFGPRPIDMHLRALEQMGCRFDLAHGYVEGSVETLRGARLVFEFPSVGATENAMMAGVLATGTTTIENAAREPEIADLAAFLNTMGARVSGAGTSTVVIEGVDTLEPADHEVVPDRIEAATFMAAVGVAGGDVVVEGARAEHMDMLITKLGDMGMEVTGVDGGLRVNAPTRLRSVDVATLPYPGIATDYKPLLVAMLTTADGVSIVTENLFAGRFRYIDELVRMGADIRTEGHHAVVRGRAVLSGAPVRAPDIRAGAALMVAALRAEGETLISGADHIARGYEDVVAKLTGIGVDIAVAD